MKENKLINCCLEYLKIKRIFHYRQNTGAFVREPNQFYRFGTKGAPDIIAVINGKYVGIECKVSGNKQSDNQIEFEKNLKQAGGLYWLIYSLEDLISNIQYYDHTK